MLNFFRRWQASRRPIGLPNALTGTFELRAGWIVGTVADRNGDVPPGLVVRLNGPEGPMADYTPELIPGNAAFRFRFAVEDRFTGADLVRETVWLSAEDADGNTGRIGLDGAAQIEMIRDHLGQPAETIFDLDLSGDGQAARPAVGNANARLGAGWSGSETDFTWTDASESLIEFDTPRLPGRYELRVNTGAFIHPPACPAQRSAILIDGSAVGLLTMLDPHPSYWETRFSDDILGAGPRSVLTIRHENAVRASDIGVSEDDRLIALQCRRIALVRLAGSQT